MKWFALITLTALSSMAFAQRTEILEQHPDSPAALGKGITKNYPTTEHNQCVKYGSTRALDTTGVRELTFDYYLVRNTSELSKTLEISGSIQAQVFFGKLGDMAGKVFGASTQLGLKGKYGNVETMKDSSLAIVIKASADYGRFEIQGGTKGATEPLKLYDEFQKLLTDKEYEKFAEICGTHFVIRETRKGMVAAIIRLEDLSSDQMKKISAELTVGENSSPSPSSVSGAATTPTTVSEPQKITSNGISTESLKKLIKNVNKVSIKFYATGGGGLADIDELVMGSTVSGGASSTAVPGSAPTAAVLPGVIGSIEGIQKGFAKYLRSFAVAPGATASSSDSDNNKSVASIYHLAPMTLFGYVPNSLKVNNTLLEAIYFEYTAVDSKAKELSDLIAASTTQNRAILEELRYYSTEYECVLSTLASLANSVLAGDTSIDFSSIPEKVDFDILKYRSQVTLKNKSFECYAQSNGKCGDKSTFWLKAKYWKSYFLVEGNISNIRKVIAMNVYYGDTISGNRLEKKIFSIKKNSKTTDKMFTANGYFMLRFGDYTESKILDYFKVIERTPSIFIGLVKTDGSEEIVELGVPELTGKHKSASENPDINGGLSLATAE